MTDPLQPGGVRYWGSHGGPVDAYHDFSALRALLNSSRVAFAMMPERIGVRSFVTFLEYTYFPPGTPMNEHFRMAIVTWGEMKWYVVIIHKMHLEKADRLLKLFGLRRADGVPTVISSRPPGDPAWARHSAQMARQLKLEEGTHVEVFPLDGKNVWTIENIEGHFTYQNNRELERKARDFEDRACDQLIEEHRQKWLEGEFKHEPGTMPPRRV